MSQSMTFGQFKMRSRFTGAFDTIKRNAALWLRQGISPRRLALTLALGFAVGCIPVIGIPTLVCAALALALRLNLPAIQAANYAVMPLQLLLIVPFVRLGGWLIDSSRNQTLQSGALLHTSPLALVTQMGWLAGQALLAWVVIAIPVVVVLTFSLPMLLRRIPAVAAGEVGD
jgi:uncharacterized protein (DUF2062 family)